MIWPLLPVLESSIQVTQCLLLDSGRALLQPGSFASFGKFVSLHVVGEFLCMTLNPVVTLFESEVPYVPSVSAVTLKNGHFLFLGIQTLTNAHVLIICERCDRRREIANKCTSIHPRPEGQGLSALLIKGAWQCKLPGPSLSVASTNLILHHVPYSQYVDHPNASQRRRSVLRRPSSSQKHRCI